MALTLIVTTAGRNALVNAANTGTAPVTVAQLGLSATAITPAANLTTLAGEFKRLSALSGDTVADDTIHLVGRDESADVYSVKSFALYLADGTLFAIYGQAATIVDKASAAIMLLAADVKFADIAASTLTFGNTNFLNPPATETVQGVAELATQAESDAGADDQRIVTPKKLKASFLSWIGPLLLDVWRASNDGSGSGLDADLLDGQHGAYYGDVKARLGYTPANKAGDDFTGVVSSSGSGNSVSLVGYDGSIEILRTPGGAYIDFKNSSADDWDVRLAQVGASGFNISASSFTFNNSTIWTMANDGAGSGLDADLLDGQDSAYFTNITARLGYTPLNAASYTAGDILGKLVTVDGSGSGLDADLLDGLNSTDFIKASTNVWQQSNDGTARFYFSGNGRTYFGTGADGWSFQFAGIDRVSINTAGDMSLRSVAASVMLRATNGTGFATMAGNGDITADRGNGAGVVYLGGSGSRYLFYDGVNYSMAGANLYVNSGLAWHSLNDGSGSGLDADLLDGQDGSYYSNITARLGYAPVNRAGDNMSGPLWVDAVVTAKTPNNGSTGGIRLRANDVTGLAYLQVLNSAENAQYGFIKFDSGGDIQWNNSRMWHAGNDGSGSGSDADMLDGRHASDFALASDFDRSVGANGYTHLPGGLIMQWINVAVSSGGSAAFSWPIEFPNNCFIAVPGAKQGLTYSGSYSGYLSGVTRTGGTAFGNNGGGAGGTLSIIAIGN